MLEYRHTETGLCCPSHDTLGMRLLPNGNVASRSASFRMILTQAFLTPTACRRILRGEFFRENRGGVAKGRKAPIPHPRAPAVFTIPVMTLAAVFRRPTALDRRRTKSELTGSLPGKCRCAPRRRSALGRAPQPRAVKRARCDAAGHSLIISACEWPCYASDHRGDMRE